MLASVDSEAAYRWVGVLIAVALGHFILTMRERYRAELAGWMDSLRASHQDLADALARSATDDGRARIGRAPPARGRGDAAQDLRRRPGQTSPSPACPTARRSRSTANSSRPASPVKKSSALQPSSLGRWDPQQPARTGAGAARAWHVRNFETELRTKDGPVVPSLVSATMVELGGEQCVISIARDISELKRTERELRAAREALSAEVRELEASQARLRDEIAERTFAQTAPGGERGDAAQDVRDQPRLDRN